MTWTVRQSAELYGVPYWGAPILHVNDAGHLVAEPRGPGNGTVDIFELTEELLDRGIELPLLLRMPQIAEQRIGALNASFAAAIEEHEYEGAYRGVYPIKVNQQRQLVEEILRAGRGHRAGLEAGSKAELLIATALMDDPDGLIVCNGYKDRRYVETALTADRLGKSTVLIVEKPSEVDTIIQVATDVGRRPTLGIRAKLSRPGEGRWKSSAGDRAKFGLSAIDIMEMIEKLRELGWLDCLRLLHFHIGSQISSVQTFKHALREATRLYVELTRLGAPMGMFDVGGGLGVDYDGSRTSSESSRNYSEAEYAATVVSHIAAACDEAGVTHPDIVTESGRATVAHSSLLLFDVLGVESVPTAGSVEPAADDFELLSELHDAYERVTPDNYQQAWHDALDIRFRGHDNFAAGRMGLEQLTQIDRLFWQVCGRLADVLEKVGYVPEEFDSLVPALADTYYANISVFQSLPDTWAVEQLFPCLPIHRLDEEPTRRAIIADLTCDSDGKLDRFVGREHPKNVLELHPLRPAERYVLAVALVGAYQEILGDMHNLFGDTHAVHIRVDDDGDVHIDQVIEGDSVTQVVGYVQYERRDLVERIRQATERAIREGRIDRKDAGAIVARYRENLESYTYLGQ